MKKVVFITGTNSGFGWLTVHSLSKAGHTVYATMRDTQGKNKERAEELAKLDGVTVLDVALTNDEAVNNAIGNVIEKEGRLDVLVNNAGYFAMGIAETFSLDDVKEMYEIHVNTTWRTMKASLPTMRKQGEGLVVNVSSGLGRFSAPFMTVYNSAKFAMEGLSEGLHYEVRALGVDVALVMPGAFPTELVGKTKMGSEQNIATEYGEVANIPAKIGEGLGHLFEMVKPNPQDVADAILKLVETPKGQRPLRTVVDPATGAFVTQANEDVKVGYNNFMTAFGLQDLLK